ncbi:MAG TPA: hypothetical protein VFM32_06390 [Spongiibacteraceae bacterium]|nr:hypothetical protein [Spongiibacteraceae bacterium]
MHEKTLRYNTSPITTGNILKQIPAGVRVMGGVSLLMNTSSEMTHSLLPMFLVTTLGASAIA